MAGNFFRGTTVDQDPRWGRSDKKLMASLEKSGKFAPILNTKVELKKVNMDIINRWITERIIEMLGFEDDIVINMVINLLKTKADNPKSMQLEITGFLEKKSGMFMEELWNLLVDAQSQPSGIPSIFIEKKKQEILSRQAAAVASETSPALCQVDAADVARTENELATERDRQSRRPAYGHRHHGDGSRDRRGDARSSSSSCSRDRRERSRRSRSRDRNRHSSYRESDRERDRDRERERERVRNRAKYREREGHSGHDKSRHAERDGHGKRDSVKSTRRRRSRSSSSTDSKSSGGSRRE